MYMSRENNRARASGAVGSHGRQSPDPDPRVFAWGREGFLAIFVFCFFLFFLLKTLKTKSSKIRTFIARRNAAHPRGELQVA